MKKRGLSERILLIVCAIITLTLLGVIWAIVTTDNQQQVFYYIISITLLLGEIAAVIYYLVKKYQSGEIYLVKWITYDKRRAKIDQEIRKLQKQLLNSDLSKYVDLKQLMIDGQGVTSKRAVNYEAFLDQFGLNINDIEIEPRSVMYLGPFNSSGTNLFSECMDILKDTSLSIYRSDNKVEKSDILRNIVTLIVKSETILVDLNELNPNVYYELGIAHALGKKTILMMQYDKDPMELGFDIRQRHVIMYRGHQDLELQLLFELSGY